MFSINNRRYLGSKFKLLDFISEVVDKHCHDCESFMDLFAGTGVVAQHFNDKYSLIVNDILKSNVLSYEAFLSENPIKISKIETILDKYNALDISKYSENYYSENFADTFLSKENMKKVGIIRDDIDRLSEDGEINPREKAILITSLVYSVDKIANTVGHYDAFRHSGDLSRPIVLQMPKLNDKLNKKNQIFNLDANKLVELCSSDIVYIDPPYNSRQYCDAYHFLENLAVNGKPEVVGVARKMDRLHLKSGYCTNKASAEFRDLIKKIKAKYIVVSYNNTGEKINSRSNAKISDDEIIQILESKGKVSIYEKDFNAFTTGKTKLNEHKERLFVCEVDSVSKPSKTKKRVNSKAKSTSDLVVKSPLNYTGGKAKLIPQISKKLPDNIDVFYDVFSGGANVAINMDAQIIKCVDINPYLIELMNYIKDMEYNELLERIEQKLDYYELSNSFRYGYEHYSCNSSNGLGSHNKKQFLKLRNDYNRNRDNLLFLILIFFSFNNQIRFNSKKEFNLPIGKRDFNASLRNKLRQFMERLANKKIEFICQDFRELKINTLVKDKAFIYLDPPYLLGTATYNENGGWTDKDENDLLEFLTDCNAKGLQFALSNVMKHKGQTHQQLLEWCLDNTFNINYLNFDYSNSNYQAKNKNFETQEVLITNF